MAYNAAVPLCALAELLSAEPYANPTAVIPVDYLRQLDAYQHTALYDHDPRVQWPTTDNETLLAAVQRASLGFADHTLATLGKTPREVGYEHRIGGDALGGFGTVALDHYAQAQLGAEAATPRELRTRERSEYTAGQSIDGKLARVEANWYTHDAPDDVVVRIVAVMTDPSTWLDLLVKSSYRETDADTPLPQGG